MPPPPPVMTTTLLRKSLFMARPPTSVSFDGSIRPNAGSADETRIYMKIHKSTYESIVSPMDNTVKIIHI
jgi:hypothetical protein